MTRRKLLTSSQRKHLLALPAPDDLATIARFYTFSAQDKQIIRQQRGEENRLGYALVLALLRYPGHLLKAQQTVPDYILNYIAEQIDVDPTVYQHYTETRDETRREHIGLKVGKVSWTATLFEQSLNRAILRIKLDRKSL